MSGLLNEIINTFMAMAPYLLLGLTFAGILHVTFSKSFVMRHLGGGGVVSVIKAALLGVPLPLCSCGVLPTAISLRKNRASEGATMSFLISTPQTGVDSILATWGMLGPVFAIFRPLAAFIMGIGGGLLINAVGVDRARGQKPDTTGVDCPMCYIRTPHRHGIGDRMRALVKYAYAEFLDDVSAHLIAGVVISGLIAYFIPPGFFSRYVGNSFVEMLIMIAGGIPLYVCATASIPIAMALMMKGLSPGAAFVFLAVGPATNAASLLLIANSMGKRFAAVYLATISAFSIIAGYMLNLFFGIFGAGISHAHGEHHHGAGGFSWSVVFSLIFLVMLVLSVYRKYAANRLRRLLNVFKRHDSASRPQRE